MEKADSLIFLLKRKSGSINTFSTRLLDAAILFSHSYSGKSAVGP
jgi:hypothetical protein